MRQQRSVRSTFYVWYHLNATLQHSANFKMFIGEIECHALGQIPIPIPSSVKVDSKDSGVQIEGPKGSWIWIIPHGIDANMKIIILCCSRKHTRQQKALHGVNLQA